MNNRPPFANSGLELDNSGLQLDNSGLQLDNSGLEPLRNFSDNISLSELIARRTLLKGGLSLAVGVFMNGCAHARPAVAPVSRLGFTAIGASRADSVQVPPGYSATPFLPWGTPIRRDAAPFRSDNSGRDQEQQMGSHHDGMHFFPIDAKTGGQNSREGLLVVNHEYIDPELLHPHGPTLGARRPVAEVHKEMAAHGLSVVHIRQNAQAVWQLVEESPYNRRITAMTPVEIRGPVRGSAKVATRFSPRGEQTRGTLNNCSHGITPWHTYLAAEENWAGYFINRDADMPREHSRYGVATLASRYRWESADSQADIYKRFDATSSGTDAQEDFRNEPNGFGWVTEIDPFDPQSVPQKRTALGRFAREGIIFAPVQEGKPLVCYSGDDAKNEYIYKFVSAEPFHHATAGGHLLDKGLLYTAQFADDGTGRWLLLDIADREFQQKAQAAGIRFVDQADLLVNTRLAADIVGATKMDRPEWGAVDPHTGEVYFSLTNNSERTHATVNAANPRPQNAYGHIVRWRPKNGDHTSADFAWDIFVFAGPAVALSESAVHPDPIGGLTSDRVFTSDTAFTSDRALTLANHFASPDGLWFDSRGILWIQTDMSGTQLSTGPFGNNQMLAADPATREIRRFLVGPVDCEITGATMTPDMRTLFVNIQHPGDTSSPEHFTSHWPDGGASRPRSATVIVHKKDGGIIGT